MSANRCFRKISQHNNQRLSELVYMHTDILLGVYFSSSKITKGLTPLKYTSALCSCSIKSRAYKVEVNHMPFFPIL